MAEQENQCLGDVAGGGFMQQDCLRLLGRIIEDHQDVFVAMGTLWKRTYQTYPPS